MSVKKKELHIKQKSSPHQQMYKLKHRSIRNMKKQDKMTPSKVYNSSTTNPNILKW
jgi:hypothetical protein